MNKKMRPFTLLLFFLSAFLFSQAQDNSGMGSTAFPNNTEAAIRADGVNTFTGLPSISVPIYSYKGTGLSWGISIDYNGGGIQTSQGPSVVGLGWNLNCNGVIARTVHGAPDDMPSNGYMWSAANPTDIRANASKYYFDTLDSEQDIYTFSFNGRSGKFVIGKNQQVVVMPTAKIKITYTLNASFISAFRVVTEDGTKYDFSTTETASQSITGGGSYGPYTDAWYLTDVISAFNTDTIKFNYSPFSMSGSSPANAVGLIAPSTNTLKYINAPYWSSSSYSINNITSVTFPDKKQVSFVYTGNTISKIKILDTVFRQGFALQYATAKSQLVSITPYTNRQADKGYTFYYNGPVTANLNMYGIDDNLNVYDYWGFYNGFAASAADSFFVNIYTVKEPNPFPQLNGSTWGTNRTPTASALAGEIESAQLPTGGTIAYTYQLNDHYPYTKTTNTLSVSGTTNTANNVTLSQVFNTKQFLSFALDKSVSRTGTAPITGSGTLTVNVKSTDGTILYATTSFSLYDLYDLGIKTWAFNVANGTYRLETVLGVGTTVTGSFPINVGWETRVYDASKTADQCGGLRVLMIEKDDITEQYEYLTADGKSSGFLGDIPQFTYPFRQTVAGTVTDYTAISSQPVDNMDYAQAQWWVIAV